MMNIVPRVPTPQPLEAITAALRTAYAAEFGRPLAQPTAELLVAQILQETRNGQSIKNNSPGNIAASNNWPGDAWRPPWFETPDKDASPRDVQLHNDMLQGKAPSAFRAFNSLDDGMRDYVHTLARQFPTILAARTPGELAHAIFDSGYTRDLTPEASEPTLRMLVEHIRARHVFDDLADTKPESPAPKGESAPVSGSRPPAPRWHFISPPVLQIGDSGPLVVLWQRSVVGAVADGLFGPRTEQLTREWQSRRGLPVTGRVAVPDWSAATTSATTPWERWLE